MIAHALPDDADGADVGDVGRGTAGAGGARRRQRRRRGSGGAAGCSRRSCNERPGGAIARDLIARELDGAKVPCVTSSFQAECVVLVHMLRELAPDIPVLFLDTFHHFPQTLTYRDDLAERWGLNLVNLRAAEPAVGLWQQDTKACCGAAQGGAALRRARAARRVVHGTAARAVGVARRAAGNRAVPAVGRSDDPQGEPARRPGRRRRCGRTPRRTTSRCCRSMKLGYTSVGCEPCTTLPLDPSNERSGRWQGQKLECGIHMQAE